MQEQQKLCIQILAGLRALLAVLLLPSMAVLRTAAPLPRAADANHVPLPPPHPCATVVSVLAECARFRRVRLTLGLCVVPLHERGVLAVG